MPILKNAKKALRASKKKRAINQMVKSKLKTNFDKVLKGKKIEDLPAAYSAIDKAVKKNLIHKHKAARLKSRATKATAV